MRARLGTLYSRLACRWLTEAVGKLPKEAGSQRQVAHLTFDDGPTPEGTPPLLEILAKHGIRATFFLLGEGAERHPDLVRDVAAAGHEIGNHSHTHRDAWKASPEEIAAEFARATGILEDVTGNPVRWLRPPFGRLNRAVVRWSRNNAQRLMMWDLMPGDFEPGATPEKITRTLTGRLRSRSIVVLHDNPKALEVTPPALREALPRLIDEGWEFVDRVADAPANAAAIR